MSGCSRGQDSLKQHSLAGTTCSVVPVKKADEADQPFPNKPVSHRRPPKTQIPLGLHDFEKTSLLTQQKGHLMSHEYPSDGIRKTTKTLHSKEISQKLPSGELQMDRAIQAKKLMLQEKLCNAEKKIRQTIQKNSADTDAGYQLKSEEERQYTGQAELEQVHTKARESEYLRREPRQYRDTMADESLQGDLKHLRKKQDERNEDRFRNEVQPSTWEVREHKTERVPNMLQKVNEHFRRKRGDEKYHGIWEETDKRHGEQNNTASLRLTTWTKGKKYKERTHKDTNHQDDKQNMPQKSPERSTHRWATENQRSTGGNLYEKSTLPPIPGSLHSSQQQQEELPLISDPAESLPCTFCNRKFQSERLEKHIQICTKVNQKQRQVFNSYNQRYKGSQLEEYLKTHPRSKSPVLITEKKKKNRKGNT